MSKIQNRKPQASSANPTAATQASKYTEKEFEEVSQMTLDEIQLHTERFTTLVKVCNYPLIKVETDSCIKSVEITDSDDDEIKDLTTKVTMTVDHNGEEWQVKFSLVYRPLFIQGTMFDEELGKIIELNISDTRRYKAVIKNMTTEVTAPDAKSMDVRNQQIMLDSSQLFQEILTIDSIPLTKERLKDLINGADPTFALRGSNSGYAGWIVIRDPKDDYEKKLAEGWEDDKKYINLNKAESLIKKLSSLNYFYRDYKCAPTDFDAPYILVFPYTWREVMELIPTGEMAVTFPVEMKPFSLTERKDDEKSKGGIFEFLREVLE